MATRRTLLATERTLDEQYAEGEVELVAVRRHPFVLLKPVGRAMIPTVLALWYTLEIPTASHIAGFLWLVTMVLWAWVLWCEAERRRNVFVITTKRVLLYEGILTRTVPMMKLSKVTDLTYHRTIAGRIFRYGTIIIESAGQDQAMHDITFLPEPDSVYAELNGALFGEKARQRSLEGVDILGHKHARGPRRRRRRDDGESGPSDGSGGSGPDDHGPDDGDGPGPGPRSGAGGANPRRRHGRTGPDGAPGDAPGESPSPIQDYGTSPDDEGPFLRGTSPRYRPAGHGSDRPDRSGAHPRAGRDAYPDDPDDLDDRYDDPTDVPPAGYLPRWRTVTDADDDETIYQSPDRRRRTARDDDTGPIPIEERRPRFT